MKYSTECVENLTQFINVAKFVQVVPSEDFQKESEKIRNVMSMRDGLIEAKKFLFPVDFNIGIRKLDNSILDIVRLPFPKITLECPLSNGVNCILFLEEMTYDGSLGIRISSLWSNAGDAWIFFPNVIFYRYGSTINEGGGCGVDTLLIERYPQIIPDSGLGESLEYQRVSVVSALKAIACINVRNVGFTEIKPSPVDVARRAGKKGKAPLFVYHICNIFLGDDVISAKPSQRKAKALASLKTLVKLHAVRGHFKRKKNGIFWWSSHIRGKRENGVVEKDYAVKAA